MVLRDLEQNDVDISKLFSYKSEISFELPDDDVITFYQKIVGDEHFNQARVYSLRKSAQLRKNLHDENWEDRDIYIPSIRNRLKDDVANIVATLGVREFTLQAIEYLKNNPIKKPKELRGNSTREEQENHQLEIDAYRHKFSDALTKKVLELTESRKKSLLKEKKEDIIKFYEEQIIEEHCEQIFRKAFKEYTTYYGTFLDNEYTVRVANTLEEFLDFPTHLKNALIENYEKMEVDANDLKKLQGVTL